MGNAPFGDDVFKTRKGEDEKDVKIVKHSARLGAELGADIVKVPYTGSPESFREVVEGCFVPVVIAGGGKRETDQDILEMVKGSMDAGGAGVSMAEMFSNTKIHRGSSGLFVRLSTMARRSKKD